MLQFGPCINFCYRYLHCSAQGWKSSDYNRKSDFFHLKNFSSDYVFHCENSYYLVFSYFSLITYFHPCQLQVAVIVHNFHLAQLQGIPPRNMGPTIWVQFSISSPVSNICENLHLFELFSKLICCSPHSCHPVHIFMWITQISWE